MMNLKEIFVPKNKMDVIALACMAMGAQPSIPTREETMRFIHSDN